MNQVVSDENVNNPVHNKSTTNLQGGRKLGAEIIRPNRRREALGVINQNVAFPSGVNKRSLQEINGFCNKNNAPVPAHRPITRKYAAHQMAVSRKSYHEEEKKQKISSSSANELSIWEDISLSDDDVPTDEPVPMSLESELTDKNQMEVEMEDIFEETILDIDGGCDAKDPLSVVDYVQDLYAFYKKMESYSCVSPDYMVKQFDINERMRAILIDWLIEVHHKFDLREETLFLTVNIIDRFLAKQSVERKKLQLVGLVAMLLACKYEEVSVPIVDDLVFISDKAYTRKQVLEMEKLMLNTLQFNMSLPTAYVFLKRFLKAAQSDRKLELLSFFLMELCLVEYEMLKYPPSFIAATAIYTAQITLYGVAQWSKTCQLHSGYSEDQLLECSKMVVEFHQNAGTGKLTGIHRKYNTSKFGYAAKFEPAAHFIVQTAATNTQ